MNWFRTVLAHLTPALNGARQIFNIGVMGPALKKETAEKQMVKKVETLIKETKCGEIHALERDMVNHVEKQYKNEGKNGLFMWEKC